jgi:hypothetical protein
MRQHTARALAVSTRRFNHCYMQSGFLLTGPTEITFSRE